MTDSGQVSNLVAVRLGVGQLFLVGILVVTELGVVKLSGPLPGQEGQGAPREVPLLLLLLDLRLLLGLSVVVVLGACSLIAILGNLGLGLFFAVALNSSRSNPRTCPTNPARSRYR